MATDITTLSALHKHITQAIKATTLNLSGTLTAVSPITILLSIPSAVHLTTPPPLLSFFFVFKASLPVGDKLIKLFNPKLSHLIPAFPTTLRWNPVLVALDSIKLDRELLEKQQENLLEKEEDWNGKDLAAIIVLVEK